MPCHSKWKTARRHAPQQIDLFAKDLPASGGMPAWSGLPKETQAALTSLMIRLILDHADKSQIAATGDGHDH